MVSSSFTVPQKQSVSTMSNIKNTSNNSSFQVSEQPKLSFTVEQKVSEQPEVIKEAEQSFKKAYKSTKKTTTKKETDEKNVEPTKEETIPFSKPVEEQVSRIKKSSFLKEQSVSDKSPIKTPTVSDLKKEEEETQERILKKYYKTSPIYAEFGQGSIIGTEQTLKPEVEQTGIIVPFTGAKSLIPEKRFFETPESKEYRSDISQLKSLQEEIYEKTTGEELAKGIDLTKLPSDVIVPVSPMSTIDPTKEPEEKSASELYADLEQIRSEKIRLQSETSGSTGIIEAGILKGLSSVGVGQEAPATKILALSKEEKEVQEEFLAAPSGVFGSEEIQKSLTETDFSSPEMLSTGPDISSMSIKSLTPEQTARRSLAKGAVEDVVTLAVTAGIGAGATKLAAKSPFAFKAVKAIDVVDDISDVYDIGSGVVNIVTGDAPGAARDIGTILAGNIVAGKASKKAASGIDFTPVAETKLEQKLFPTGVPITSLGYDIDAELDLTTEPSPGERRIGQQLAVLPTKTKAALVSDGPEFQPVIIETKPTTGKQEQFVSAALGSRTEAPDFGVTSTESFGAVLETPGETVITRAKPQEGKLTGIIKDGRFKQVKRNIPKEKIGEFIGEQKETFGRMLRSKKADVGVTTRTTSTGLRMTTGLEVEARPKLLTDIGFEPEVDVKTKTTPVLQYKSRSMKLSDLISKPSGIETTKPVLEAREDIKPDVTVEPALNTETRSRIDTSIFSDVTPTTTPTPTLTITPSPTVKAPRYDFTPKRMQFKLPRNGMSSRIRGRKAKEFTVENAILDITKGFKIKPIKGKTDTTGLKVKPISGIDSSMSKRLKRFL